VNRGDAHRDKNRPGENARPEAHLETEDAIAHHSPNMAGKNQANTPCQRDVPAICGGAFDVSALRALPENQAAREQERKANQRVLGLRRGALL
jgi:hypothetical protein